MRALVAVLFLFSLAACHGAARVEGDGYSVDVDSGGHHHNGSRFCPPGQAKKGNC